MSPLASTGVWTASSRNPRRQGSPRGWRNTKPSLEGRRGVAGEGVASEERERYDASAGPGLRSGEIALPAGDGLELGVHASLGTAFGYTEVRGCLVNGHGA